MEHRCGTRYAVEVPAYVRTQDGLPSGFGRLRQVSASGGFVETRLEVQPLSRVAVQLLTHWHSATPPAQSQPLDSNPPPGPLIVEAQVIRLGLQGIYLEWTEYAPDLVRQLKEHPERSDRLSTRTPLLADSKDGVPAILAPLAESLQGLERRD